MPPGTPDDQQHRNLQKEYGAFYRAVSDILFRHDPMELDKRRNTGDYDRAIDVLLSRIGEAEHPAAMQDLLFEVFQADFGAENCGSRERYEAAASEIWKAYERRRTPRPATIPAQP